MKRWGLTIALLGAVVLAGCSSSGDGGGEAVVIELNVDGMAFDQKEITVQNGQTFKLVLNNKEAIEHDFVIAKIPGKAVKHGDDSHGAKVDLMVHAQGNQTESVEFTPSKEGTYEFYCAIAGHKDAGMKGNLIVQ